MSSEVPAPKVINYQGNSKVDREVASEEAVEREPSKLKKIEGVNVVKAKPSLGKRIKEGLTGDDAKTVGLYLLTGVFLPKMRDLAFDLIQEGAHRSLYGDGRKASGSTVGNGLVGTGTRIRQTNYGAPSSRSNIVGSVVQAAAAAPAFSQSERSNFDFSSLVFTDLAKAEEVLERLGAAIDEFNVVPVADFYDAIGVTGTGFTDMKFGWDRRNFSGAGISRVRNGWVLELPAPREI